MKYRDRDREMRILAENYTLNEIKARIRNKKPVSDREMRILADRNLENDI